MRWLMLLALAALAACDVQTTVSAPPVQTSPVAEMTQQEARSRASIAARQFITVVETVEPVAERECRRRAPGANCDFQIVVDDRPGQAPNAFQTIDRTGRPILAFNLALIASVENADELAFVMGHEAAHHVLGHLGRTQQNAGSRGRTTTTAAAELAANHAADQRTNGEQPACT